MNSIKIFNSENIFPAFGPFSHAAMTENFFLPSGQLGINPETGSLVDGGAGEETRQIFSNIEALLSEAGLSLKNIIKATVYITDMEYFDDMNRIYAEYFDGDYPSRVCVGVSSLAKNAKVEIDFICVK